MAAEGMPLPRVAVGAPTAVLIDRFTAVRLLHRRLGRHCGTQCRCRGCPAAAQERDRRKRGQEQGDQSRRWRVVAPHGDHRKHRPRPGR